MEEIQNEGEQGLVDDWMFNEQYHQETQFQVNKMKFTEPEVIKKIYYIMRMTDEILIQNNIQYWGTFGTALGCIRHKGVIPWDDDLDIGLKETDEEQFTSENIRQQFKQKGLIISKINFGYKIYIEKSNIVSQKLSDENDEEYGFPFCDVFVMKLKGKKWIIKDKDSQKGNPKEIYKNCQIKNIQRKQFADFQINVSGDVEEYLKNSYGENWATEAKTHFWDHVNQRIVIPELFTLTEDLLKPALPFQ